MRAGLLGLVFLAALCGNAFGNTGVFAGSGHSLQLVKSADVQMVSEDVMITPMAGTSSMDHSVDFRCTFVLKNRSAKSVKIQVGFPLDRESNGPPQPPSSDTDMVLSYHFIARDKDNTYHVRYAAADQQSKFKHIFLWDMDFAAGETKTLHIGYILPMSFAGVTTRKAGASETFLHPPEYDKPWHVRLEGCMVVYFSYVTETGQSWAGPIEKAKFHVRNHIFEYDLEEFPEYVGGKPADIPAKEAAALEKQAGEGVPGMADLGFVFGMKLGTVYPCISPEDWKSVYIPEIPPGEPKPPYEPDGIEWTYKNYKPGPPLTFKYYLVGFPAKESDCERWVHQVLGRTPTKADVLELREIVAAFFGIMPETASTKRFVEQQVWYNPQSKMRESQLSEPRRAVLSRLMKIANDRKDE